MYNMTSNCPAMMISRVKHSSFMTRLFWPRPLYQFHAFALANFTLLYFYMINEVYGNKHEYIYIYG